jgi:hypothetical protein
MNFTGAGVTATNTGGAVTVAVTGGGGGLTGFTAAESTAAPNATVYVDSLTSSAASTNADVAFVAKGTGATLAQVPNSTTAGGNKRGTHATDWQKSRTSATQVASGNYSGILSGQNNTASGTNAAVVGGSSNTASGSHSAVLSGESNTASNTYAVVIGGTQSIASSLSSTVIGGYGGRTRSITAYTVSPASYDPVNGFGTAQSALLVLGKQTTNATPAVLTCNGNAAATTNQVILPNNSAYTFQGTCIANVTGGGTTSGWKFEGVIKRGATAASTTLVAAVTPTVIAQDAGAATWVLAITADTTNGGIKVEVTGAAATTIRWVAKIETTEVTF